MTIIEIKKCLAPTKAVSTAQLYRYLKLLKIQPVGPKQHPQHYQADTPARILDYLGLRSIVSMSQLRAERAKAHRAGSRRRERRAA
jgi:hypothetical protein